MRQRHTYIMLLAYALVISSCGRKVIDKAPENPTKIEVSSPYYQKMVPGMEDGETTLDLVLPLTVSPVEVQVDSVYFQGMKAPLRKTTSADQTIYKTTLYTRSGAKTSPPMDIGTSEALIVYRYQSNRYFFKVENVVEKEAVYAP